MESSRTEWVSRLGEQHFGHAQLGDQRRTARLVRTADLLVRHPGGRLPEKMSSPRELEGLSHLMKCSQVTHAAVLGPHIARTRAAVRGAGGV